MLVRIRQGKGRKDRYTVLSKVALDNLDNYIESFNPEDWLFPGENGIGHLTERTVQKIFEKAKEKAKITKDVSIHSLRHYVESQVMGSVTLKGHFWDFFHEITPHNTFYSHKEFSHLIKSPFSSHLGSPSGTKSGYAFSIALRFISLSALA
jgi:integrase/recombinase XerD